MGVSFFVVIFSGLVIAPLVLGSFIVSQDASQRTLNSWFGFATIVFIAMIVLGAVILVVRPA